MTPILRNFWRAGNVGMVNTIYTVQSTSFRFNQLSWRCDRTSAAQNLHPARCCAAAVSTATPAAVLVHALLPTPMMIPLLNVVVLLCVLLVLLIFQCLPKRGSFERCSDNCVPPHSSKQCVGCWQSGQLVATAVALSSIHPMLPCFFFSVLILLASFLSRLFTRLFTRIRICVGIVS